MSVCGRTTTELSDLLRRGDASAVDIATAHLDRIEALDDEIGGFLCVDREGALQQATQIDRRRARGELLGPLAGIPIAVKDNLCAIGATTTCARPRSSTPSVTRASPSPPPRCRRARAAGR